jgi:signal peptidase II
MRLLRPKASTLLPFLGVLIATAGCDHVAKRVAVASLDAPRHFSLAGAVLHLEVTTNVGAFLNLGEHLPEWVRSVVFLALVPAVVVWLCARLLAGSHVPRGVVLGLGLLAGGGLSNWMDRLVNGGAVTDFMVFGIGPLHTGVFNVADVAVMAGSGILLLSAWWAGDEAKTR